MKSLLLTFILVSLFCTFAIGCEAVGVEDEGSSNGEVTFVNQTDRPIAVDALEKEASYLIFPAPVLRKDQFEELKIRVGATRGPENIPEYQKGDDLVIIAYARCKGDSTISKEVSEKWGSEVAPIAASFDLSAEQLDAQSYRIAIEELDWIEQECRLKEGF